jgi:hypothetical protein
MCLISLVALTLLAGCGNQSTENGTESPTGETDKSTVTPEGTHPDFPLPAGSEIATGEWKVTFSNVVPDATETVLAEADFNEPPAEGFQYFMFRVDATYLGDGASHASNALDIGVYADGTVHINDCGLLPDDLYDTSRVYNGWTASGNDCVAIPSNSVEDVLISVVDSRNSEEPYFVKID